MDQMPAFCWNPLGGGCQATNDVDKFTLPLPVLAAQSQAEVRAQVKAQD